MLTARVIRTGSAGKTSRLSVAAGAMLYPMLALDSVRLELAGQGRRPTAEPEAEIRQILVVDEPLLAGPQRELIGQVLASKRRTIIVPLAMRWEDADAILSSLDPRIVGIAAPAHWLNGGRLHEYAFAAPLLPGQPGLDRLLRSRLRCLATAQKQHRRAQGPLVVCMTSNREGLIRLAPSLRDATGGGDGSLAIVTPDPARIDACVRDLGLEADIWSEADAGWLDLLTHARVALVPASPHPTLAEAVWMLTAMRAGVPLAADAHPLLDGLASAFITGDWDRALAVYLNDTSFSRTDAALGQTLVQRMCVVEHAAAEWRRALAKPPKAASRAAVEADRPTLMVFIDLPQDLDVCLPILLAVREQARFDIRIIVTDWLEREAPRTLSMLAEAGFEPEIVPRKDAIARSAPGFDGVHALLVPSATNQPPHRAGYGLTCEADAAGVATFTLQHGFENVGLTYRDQRHADNVLFRSRTVFTWRSKDNLPDWVPIDTLERVIGVGSSKLTPVEPEPVPLGDAGGPPSRWTRSVGIFENLHWHRYSEAYIAAFIDNLVLCARELPDVHFLVKPHSAGRWLVKNRERVPKLANIFVIDPLHPDWLRFTAPALLSHVQSVITTASTVAVDAVRAGRPVAVIGDGDNLMSAYAPLPVLNGAKDWLDFVRSPGTAAQVAERNEMFLRRNFLPYRGDWRIAELMWRITAQSMTGLGRRSVQAA